MFFLLRCKLRRKSSAHGAKSLLRSCIYHVNGDSEEHEGGNDDQPHLSCKLQNHQVVLYFSKKLEYLSILRHPRRDKTELFTDRSKQELGRKVAQKIAVEEL